jgi:hypothetical protein
VTDLQLVEATPEGRTTEAERAWAGPDVPVGHVVMTGYVATEKVVCLVDPAHQLNPAAVERAYRRQLAAEDGQEWPPPTGHWREDGRFVLTDGRHRFVASLMLGTRYVLVAWLRGPRE